MAQETWPFAECWPSPQMRAFQFERLHGLVMLAALAWSDASDRPTVHPIIGRLRHDRGCDRRGARGPDRTRAHVRCDAPRRGAEGRPPHVGDRPGDDFNRRASWGEILEPAGWRH